MKSVAAGLRLIQAEQILPAPAALSDELLQQKLGLVLPADAVTTMMGMWTGTVQYAVSQPNVLPAAQLDPTAFASIPALTIAYDPVLQAQKLSYLGVLTNDKATALQAANPSPLLASLLNSVTAIQNGFYNKYLSPFLTLQVFQGLFTAPAAGATDADIQAALVARRASLLQALLPYIRLQLSRQFVVQTATGALNVDASFTQTLLTNPSLLNDPSQPTALLADAFAGLANNAVDVLFFGSTDGTGAPLSAPNQTLASADTTGQTPSGANSVHFEGYLEVPATGPYRFFLQIGKTGTQIRFTLDVLADPLIQGVSAADGVELTSQNPVDLKAGVPCFFTLDAYNLSGGDVRLSIQGETLPKDLISQLTLYSKVAVDGGNRARILLAKAFQIIGTFGLTEREIRNLLAAPNAPDFDNLSFSSLPASIADDSIAKAESLFQQFLRLAGYVRLRGEMAGGGDGLIDIFENARRTYPSSSDPNATQAGMQAALFALLATLTRRDPATIAAAAEKLGSAPVSAVSSGLLTVTLPAFRQEQGIRKVWQLLKLAAKLGVSVDALARWANPAPDSAIAHDLRQTVKARYEPEQWLVVAPSFFDKLRQLQRDALVAHIMFKDGFTDNNQLFEYFLVDPGMEPVIQTSRLRLALSSLQTFVQRCLLDLEPEVAPAALEADQWQWMKYYRVWQANREIFLFPENWLEPEFRDDKTDLFQELEGTLLQGDITNDLAEDALFTYLSKLEQIARLEIVSISCEDNALDPDSNVLHVIGRTRTVPRNYFYRSYANQMWTAWQSITTQIDGDHVLGVIWQNRLNVFWLTFIEQVNPPTPGDSSQTGDSQHTDKKLTDMSFGDLTHAATTSNPIPDKVVQVQLNWTEYYQGNWSTPNSSGGSSDSGDDDSSGGSSSAVSSMTIIVESDFDRSSVSIHASVEEEDGTDVAKIHIHFPRVLQLRPEPQRRSEPPRPAKRRHSSAAPGPVHRHCWAPMDCAFQVISKHSPPDLVPGSPPNAPPFPDLDPETTHFRGRGPFKVHYVESIQFFEGKAPTIKLHTQDILRNDAPGSSQVHVLTVCGTALHPQTPEVGVLVTPFFFADSQNTFFVEPSLTEKTIKEWDHWAIPHPKHAPRFKGVPARYRPKMAASFPRYRPPAGLPSGGKPFNGVIDASARYHLNVPADNITGKSAALNFGGHAVGANGSSGPVTTRTPANSARSTGRAHR